MRRVVSPKQLREYAVGHSDAQRALDRWEQTVTNAEWRNPADVKRTFNNINPVILRSGRTVYIFNITGAHRLIAAIHFNTSMVYVLRVMTHKEYDRNRWKEEL